MTLRVSERFLSLVHYQLAQFADCDEVRSLVVYVAQSGQAAAAPALVPVGQWPHQSPALEPVASTSPLRQPAQDRRWLPLRQERLLLGALQVQTHTVPWPEPLGQRLQAVALCLTEALRQDLEHQRLQQQLQHQDTQLEVLVHQLRNPLTALRTFGQLLLRRLEDDPRNRPLVEGLLAEERQLNRYVDALAALGASGDAAALGQAASQPLLLPPLLSGPEGQPLSELLEPLVSRAAATAALQHRPWRLSGALPPWQGDSGAVAEIIANLLENAFRYSPQGVGLGLHAGSTDQGGPLLCVWDGGAAIAPGEREAIFGKGIRGERGRGVAGTGLGLALARELAGDLGGALQLVIPPAAVSDQLPDAGNAFCLSLPNLPPQPSAH